MSKEPTKLEMEADINKRSQLVSKEIDAILKKHQMGISLQLQGYPQKLEPILRLVDLKFIENAKVNEEK